MKPNYTKKLTMKNLLIGVSLMRNETNNLMQ